ncbi:hypothetical protein [Glaciibacter superstes]|uniref:hypothetical protein n=1 Tax=Glaciibacter superstes TaxID=501023 RepID=UPI00047E3C6C|nr:hypothetical protein [Glaciibacter superstes]
MVTLRIQHPVPDFARWKRAFDADPAKRRDSGVIRYTVQRSVSNPNFVMIDLEFGSVREAEVFLTKMRRIWEGSGSTVMFSPESCIAETVESVELTELAATT